MTDETKIQKNAGYSEKELEIMHNVEKCKLECETRVPGRKTRLSNSAMLIFLIALVFMNVVIVVYAVYEIVHISGMANLAGIHVTPSMQKAANFFENGLSKK